VFLPIRNIHARTLKLCSRGEPAAVEIHSTFRSHAAEKSPLSPRLGPRTPSRGFLPWRFSYAGPGVRGTTFMGPASENLHRTGRHAILRRRLMDPSN
jgi:hypothetical protein